MDAKLNSLPAITDFEAAYIIAQYAHENGLRAATGKDFYLWITGMLDLLGLSNTAGLPQFMPAPGATLTATDEKQWTFLFPNDDGTAATYNKITSGTITVPGDSIAIAQFDGTDYNTVRFIKMPKTGLADDFGESVDDGATQRLVTALRDRIDEVEGEIPSVTDEFGDSVTEAAAQKLVTDVKQSLDSKLSIITNDEFIYAIVTSDDVLLWGKRRDGSTYDCDLSVYQYTDTQISALNQLIGDLTVLVNTINDDYLPKSAVKNETGSSTTTTISQKLFSDFKTWVDNKLSIITNEEFVYAIVDQNNTLLWGKRFDGSTYDCDKEIPVKLDTLLNKVAITNIQTITNEEYIYAIVDSDNILLWGKRRDGSTYDSDDKIIREIETLKVKVALLEGRISVISSPEFIYAIVTSDNIMLWGKRRDGSTYDCDLTLPNELAEVKERLSFYEKTISSINNPEYLSVTTDNGGKVIEAILRDGTRYLRKLQADSISTGSLSTVSLNTDSLKLTDDGMSQLQQDLKNSGFKSGGGDWSEEMELRLPIPRVPAKINLLIPRLPTTKTNDIEGEMEYYDYEGNYFKKSIIINAQGSSSMAYDKKNFSFDLDDDSEIKFGDWVVQDSWHMKAHYTDAFKSNNNVAYDIFEELARRRPYGESRVWDYALKTGHTETSGTGKFDNDFDTGARGFPDGFPCVVYHNGEFHGIYMFNLKKHRDNYRMKRGNENHIHLDGEIGAEEIFNGTIDWTAFEIRNPNPRQKQEEWELQTLSGDKYDSDSPTEIGNTGKTGLVKASIERLSESVNVIKNNLIKEEFENYFVNIWMFSDYLIMSNVLGNSDAYRKNWQWVTWDGGQKWTIAPYDWDSLLGINHLGTTAITRPPTLLGVWDETPMKYFWSLYQTETCERYKELRDSGFITVDNIFRFFKNRVDWIGYENFDKENDRWEDMPFYRDSEINENWQLKSRDLVTGPINYNDNDTYLEGAEVIYGVGGERYVFVAKNEVTGVAPLDKLYDKFPRALGFHNSLTRSYLWLQERIEQTDILFNYNT